MVIAKIISAQRAYHSVYRRRRGNLKVRSSSSKVNEAGASASNTRFIDHYKELKTGGRLRLKEEIQEAKVDTVGEKG